MDRFFKETYEVPMAEVMGLSVESHFLSGSVEATRSGYGEALEGDWN